jgi:hypothetical protein
MMSDFSDIDEYFIEDFEDSVETVSKDKVNDMTDVRVRSLLSSLINEITIE